MGILMKDGFNGNMIHMHSEPIEVDDSGSSGMVKLRCSEEGKEYLTGWFWKEEWEAAYSFAIMRTNLE